MISKLFKYNILDKLKNLPVERYKVARNKLPIALGVSKQTFKTWLYIKQDDSRQIPLNQLNTIAHFLNVPISELINEKPHVFTHDELVDIKVKKRKNKFKIQK